MGAPGVPTDQQGVCVPRESQAGCLGARESRSGLPADQGTEVCVGVGCWAGAGASGATATAAHCVPDRQDQRTTQRTTRQDQRTMVQEGEEGARPVALRFSAPLKGVVAQEGDAVSLEAEYTGEY